MADEQKPADVKEGESSTPNEEQDVKEVISEESSTPEAPIVDEGVPTTHPDTGRDERGVPYYQVAREYQRKLDEAEARLRALEETATKNKGTEEEYTVADLERYALANPAERPWVEQKKEELRQKQLERKFEEFSARERERYDSELTKKSAFDYVVKSYSDCFKKDASGKIVGWDDNNPLTQRIAALYNNPELKQRPDGLSVAADIAYGQYAREQMAKIKAGADKAKGQAKKLEKNAMPEGGGDKPAANSSEFSSALDKVGRTGKVQDARPAMANILKRQGLIKE